MNSDKELLRTCIIKIAEPKFEELVETVLEQLPGDYLQLPSCKSGKSHPRNDTMLIHTKRVFKLALQGIERYNILNTWDKAIILTGALLHDIPYKFQKIDGEYKSNKNHAIDNAIYVQNIMRQINFREISILALGAVIGFHMYRWQDYDYNKEWFKIHEKYYKEHVTIVQDADYFASRSYINVDIGDL